ncbi:MAG: FAD-dependent oxidoreductase [bacterium]|jgi:hypothetical protein|nr:FAD-dependent oxidoreductase [bacterium]
MNRTTLSILFTGIIVLSSLLGTEAPASPVQAFPSLAESYDVIVAGAGTGGVGAALQAARLGARTLLVEETDWIGGQMSAASVTSMDEGYPPRRWVRSRGVYREFIARTEAFYMAVGQSNDTCAVSEDHFGMEPHIAQRILYAMIADTQGSITPSGERAVLDVVLRAQVTEVRCEGNQIQGVRLHDESGSDSSRDISCTVLIDATEYGDVIPLTGARYRVSHLTSDQLQDRGDTNPPVQYNTWTASIRQYSGSVPESLRMTTPPPGYDPTRIAPQLDHGDSLSHRFPWSFTRFLKYRGMPDSSSPFRVQNGNGLVLTRSCINFGPNDHPFDLLDIEDRSHRAEAEYQCILKTLRVIYYIQNKLGRMDWSVANDIGYDSPYNHQRVKALLAAHPELTPYEAVLVHMPPIPYVRESRRIVGDFALTAKDVRRKKPFTPRRFPSAIALNDYPVDIHGGEEQVRYLEVGLDSPEDFPQKFDQWGHGAFQVPFECLIPETIDGLIPAEKNLSQSRMANGATRLQPSTMLNGQAAGALAGLAVRLRKAPRLVPVLAVQEVLLDARNDIAACWYDDIDHGTELWKAIQLAWTYQVYEIEGRDFGPLKKVTPENILACKTKLQALRIPGAETPADLRAFDGEIATRAELARAAAQAIRSMITNPFRMGHQ